MGGGARCRLRNCKVMEFGFLAPRHALLSDLLSWSVEIAKQVGAEAGHMVYR